MDNTKKCLCIALIALIFALTAISQVQDIEVSGNNSGTEVILNNTNLAPTFGTIIGTGERVNNATYWANNSSIDIHAFAHANTTSQTAEVDLYINNTLVSPRSGRPLGGAEEAFRGVDVTIPQGSFYRVFFANYHHYEWREYPRIRINGTTFINNTNITIINGSTNRFDEIFVNKISLNNTSQNEIIMNSSLRSNMLDLFIYSKNKNAFTDIFEDSTINTTSFAFEADNPNTGNFSAINAFANDVDQHVQIVSDGYVSLASNSGDIRATIPGESVSLDAVCYDGVNLYFNPGLTTCLMSPERIKTNISYMSGTYLNKIKTLKPMYYDEVGHNQTRYGFIAEDVINSSFPEIAINITPRHITKGNYTYHHNESGLQGVEYEQITAINTKAIQELDEKISNSTYAYESSYYRQLYHMQGTPINGSWVWYSDAAQTDFATQTNNAAGEFYDNSRAKYDEYDWPKIYLSKGTYNISLITFKSPATGIYELRFGNQSVCSKDLYSSSTINNFRSDCTFSLLNSSRQNIRLIVIGKNASSTANQTQFSRFWIEKIGEV